MIALGDGIFGNHYLGDKTLSGPLVATTDQFSFGNRKLVASVDPAWVRDAAAAAEKERHRGQYNVAFCDGHIEQIKAEPLFSSDPEMKRRWNYDNETH